MQDLKLIFLLIGFNIFNILDIVTTTYCLTQFDNTVELNPVMCFAIDRFGFIGAGILKFILILFISYLILYFYFNKELGAMYYSAVFCFFLYGVVVALNTYRLYKLYTAQ